MKIYISIVSHRHYEYISKNLSLIDINKSDNVELVIRDNYGEKELEKLCKKNNINYFKNNEKYGFGKNNNLNFNFFREKFHISKEDFFLILNPDVFVSLKVIYKLKEEALKNFSKLSTINLYKDENFSESDDSIRKKPKLSHFILSFLKLTNNSSFKKNLTTPSYVDCAAGSFLFFNFEYFGSLDGFDEKFFMYCEDFDICLRSSEKYNQKVLYFPSLKACHLSQRLSRNFFSKDFIWHLKSVVYFVYKHKLFF